MSKSKPKVLFAGMTLWDLNPDNFSIKNDFMENLIYVATVSGGLIKYIKDKLFIENVNVVRGYKSYGSCDKPTYWEKFHCSGSAILFTWEMFNREEIKKLLLESKFVESIDDDRISIVLDDAGMRIVNNNKSMLIEIVDGKERVVLGERQSVREAER